MLYIIRSNDSYRICSNEYELRQALKLYRDNHPYHVLFTPISKLLKSAPKVFERYATFINGDKYTYVYVARYYETKKLDRISKLSHEIRGNFYFPTITKKLIDLQLEFASEIFCNGNSPFQVTNFQVNYDTKEVWVTFDLPNFNPDNLYFKVK